ncbi:MAG: SGNH/GDSL hydrolase family protein [Coprococcus sp.]
MASHSDTTGIIDTDSRFVIDIVTGKIENHSDKESLRQYSHNSERFSFEMPRHVEGHDMTNCTKVTVNYLAADIPGEYEVDDLAVDSEADDKITFSWLISSNVTQKKGKLRFAVVFECAKEDGTITYRWPTDINYDYEIKETISNDSGIVYENVDILEQWKQQLFYGSNSVTANIQAEGRRQQALVANKGSEVKKSIPDDYATLSDRVSELCDHMDLNIVSYTFSWIGSKKVNTTDGKLFDPGIYAASSLKPCYSNFVTIGDGIDHLEIHRSANDNKMTGGAFYSAASESYFISGFKEDSGNNISVPDGAKYFRINSTTDGSSNLALVVNGIPKETAVEVLKKSVEDIKADAEETNEEIRGLKEDVVDSLGEFRYHGKFTSGSKYFTVDTSIAPKKGDLIFFRVEENNSALFSSTSLFLYYTDNNYDIVTISKVGDYKFVVAQKDYIKSRIGGELSQADATEPTWSATVMSSEKHSLTGSLMLFYSLLDSGIELRKNDIENLKTDFISKHSKRFVVSKSKNNTYLDFTVDANDKGLIFVSETNATKFTAYDLYGHKPDDTFELLESNISVVGSIHTYDNNNRYDHLRIVFKCSAPSTSDEYISAVYTTDTECTAFGFITRLLGDVDNLKETSATREQIADLDSRMLKSEEIVLFQRNIINVNNLISGKYVNNQGDLKDNADYSVTDYEFVEPDTTYTFWRWGTNVQFGQNAFYDKSKKFISYQNGGKKWTAPSNAYYVRMSMPTTSFTNGNSIVCKGTGYTDDTTYQNEYKTVVKHYITREEIAKVNIPDVVESDTLSTLTIEASNSKKNNVIGFEANFSTMGSIRIAHGTSYDANRSASIVVDATNIYLYDKSTNLRTTYPHGLTMDKFITVSIVVGQIRTAKIILTTANGRFIQDTDFWGGCREDVTAQAISGTFTNARLTWYVPDYNYDLWAFGDSYFDFWVADIIQNLNYHNFMSDGFGGRGSASAFKSLKLALEKATPKKILWCLGMNDPDTADSIDANWKNTVDNLINLCDEKGIELILCTIPITPVTEHKYKNAYVKASGKRYVDVCHAVGADISPEWYEGMRTNTETDKIHPTNPLGTRTIADYMLENVPELAN